MNKKPISKKEVLDYLYSFPIEDFSKIVKDYDKQHKTKLNEEVDKLYASEMEQRLFNAGVNSTCPHCHSANIVKRGRTNFQRYVCKDCNKLSYFYVLVFI